MSALPPLDRLGLAMAPNTRDVGDLFNAAISTVVAGQGISLHALLWHALVVGLAP